MKRNLNIAVCLIVVCACASKPLAMSSSLRVEMPTKVMQVDTILPDIFILGQDEGLEQILDEKFPISLVKAHNGDASRAFEVWSGMIVAMERFSDQDEFDVKGIKAFATVYWDKNGYIKHIGYSLKPYSRNFKLGDLEKFFRRFIESYRLPVKAKSKFQHTFTLALPYPREIIRIDKSKESSTTSKQ